MIYLQKQREVAIEDELDRLYDYYLAPFDKLHPSPEEERSMILVVNAALTIRERILGDMRQRDLRRSTNYNHVLQEVDNYRDELVCYFDAQPDQTEADLVP